MAAETPGALVGTGRSADVYDLGNGRVLRRYRDQREPGRVAAEAEVMARARAFGVPVPEVFDVSGADIVMERAAGPTMLEFVGRRPWTVRTQARLLAQLHGLVHQVPGSGLSTPLPATTPGLDDDVLLHGDLHPKNVILTAGGPMIIAWAKLQRWEDITADTKKLANTPPFNQPQAHPKRRYEHPQRSPSEPR